MSREGELVFILNNGLAPIKREKVIGTWAPPPSVVVDASKRRPSYMRANLRPPILVNIALPYYESRPNQDIERPHQRFRQAGRHPD